MMKNLLKITSLIIFITLNGVILACDICSPFNFGNLTNRNTIRLDYQHKKLWGYNQNLSDYYNKQNNLKKVAHKSGYYDGNVTISDSSDYETIRQFNLGIILNHRSKTNFLFNLPIRFNEDYYGKIIPEIGPAFSQKNTYKGLGDINIGIQRYVIQSDSFKTWSNTLRLGALLTMPTGKNETQDLLDGDWHLQPGRGIWSSDVNVNYTLQKLNSLGVTIEFNYQIPFKYKRLNRTFYDFEYGRVLVGQFNFFKIWDGALKKGIIIGSSFEKSDQEKINKLSVPNSGYSILNSNIGILVQWNDFTLIGNYLIPFYKNYNGLQLTQNQSFSMSLMKYFRFPKRQ